MCFHWLRAQPAHKEVEFPGCRPCFCELFNIQEKVNLIYKAGKVSGSAVLSAFLFMATIYKHSIMSKMQEEFKYLLGCKS